MPEQKDKLQRATRLQTRQLTPELIAYITTVTPDMLSLNLQEIEV